MATTSKPLKPLPQQDAHWIGADGKPTPEFYEAMKRLFETLAKVRTEIP